MSLAKAWTASEAQTLKFSADFFDLWNRQSSDHRHRESIVWTITNTIGTPRLVQFSPGYAF
jgi:hypothetical protein